MTPTELAADFSVAAGAAVIRRGMVEQEGLAVARIARDDPSPLSPEIPASSHPTIRVRRCQ